MLVRFKPSVSLQDVGNITDRCDELEVRYKYIQEMSTSWLVVESNDHNKIEELYHQLRHMRSVDSVTMQADPDDPLKKLDFVKIKAGNRWIGYGSRPVVIAGSPYLESQKNAIELAGDLANIGATVYKAGPYRPTETLSPKDLYERTSVIISDVEKRGGLPSTGMIEMLGPKNAIALMKPCAYHVPGEFMFNDNLLDQLAKLMVPVLLERHPDASTELWLEAARAIVREGNLDVALVETGRRVESSDRRVIDLVELSGVMDQYPLPILIYPSRAARNADEVSRIARAGIGMGLSGVILDVHPNPTDGLLTDGFCISKDEFIKILEALKPLNI